MAAHNERTIFDACLELDPADRATFLEQACAQNPALADRVRQLLAAHDQAKDLPSSFVNPFAVGPEELLDRLRVALVGRYDVERQMAVGGMATVFVAQDLRHTREVAIKVLHPSLSATLGVDRFLREISIAARLRHPHILPLFDSGEADDLLFYVMPVEGESLRHRLDRDVVLPLDEAIRIADQVLDALAHAHQQDVIHRDIKPENILLSHGHAIVADFGIARAVGTAASDRVTQAGLPIGTPAYMSPEQLVGDPRLDARCDIYAVACVMYEMLLGKKPIRDYSAEAGTITRMSIPAGVREVLDRAWAVERTDRFSSAREFAQALNAAHKKKDAGRGEREKGPRSVAVLPFANMTANPDEEYFSDGMTDEIINALTRIEDLHVAARTSSFAFKHKTDDISSIGMQLGVATVLEGSVRRVGTRVRIMAQLIDVSNGYHIWSERYDRDMGDVFAIQDDIAAAIAERLVLTLAEGRKSASNRSAPENIDAYTLYLKGRHLWNRRSAAALREAVNFFTESMTLDPDYAPAYAGLADACILLGSYGHMAPLDALAQTKSATQKALAIDPSLAEAHATLGQVLRSELDWIAEEQAYRRAIELNPNYATAHQWYSTLLLALGRNDEARTEIRRAEQLDPLSHAISVTAGIVELLSGDRVAAKDHFDKTLKMAPDFFSAHAWLALLYQLEGQHDEALREAEVTVELNAGAGRMEMAYVNAFAGNREVAWEFLKEAEMERPQHVLAAMIHAVLGENDQAFGRLELAFAEEGWSFFVLHQSMLFYAKSGPWFDPIRNDPRFVGVLERMRLI